MDRRDTLAKQRTVSRPTLANRDPMSMSATALPRIKIIDGKGKTLFRQSTVQSPKKTAPRRYQFSGARCCLFDPGGGGSERS